MQVSQSINRPFGRKERQKERKVIKKKTASKHRRILLLTPIKRFELIYFQNILLCISLHGPIPHAPRLTMSCTKEDV